MPLKPYRIIPGDVRAGLRSLPAESVHCCVTSPPYWGLRAYGTEPQVWGGDAEDCEHEWDTSVRKGISGGTASEKVQIKPDRETGTCRRCGAIKCELGSEPTPDLFVRNIVEVFREVWRVLRKDGTCWVNMGDSYASSVNGNPAESYRETDDRTFRDKPFSTVVAGLKPKDLVGMPWRVALALQEDGWWLRSDIIWSKSNPLPSSVTDRPSTSHEYLFLLAKSARYYYDVDAIREPFANARMGASGLKTLRYSVGAGRTDALGGDGKKGLGVAPDHPGRNRRTVWTIPTQPYPESHFATYPEALVEPCLKVGTSERGCCPHCGAGWVRVVERTTATPGQAPGYIRGTGVRSDGDRAGHWVDATSTTTGWEPTCRCPHTEADLIPATVLDPFCGSGTTLAVAVRHGRWGIGCELQPEYIKMALRRIDRECGLFSDPIPRSETPPVPMLLLDGGAA